MFYYVTHINNVPSILEKGIFSRERVKIECVQHTEIADGEIVDRRWVRRTPDEKSLWHYVNLFFWPYNRMTYIFITNRPNRVVLANAAGHPLKDHEKIFKEDIAILEIADTVLQEPGVCIADGNAAKRNTQIYRLSESIQIFRQQQQIRQHAQPGPRISWKDAPELADKVAAECLVPIQVDPKHIGKLLVADDNVANSLRSRLASTDIRHYNALIVSLVGL